MPPILCHSASVEGCAISEHARIREMLRDDGFAIARAAIPPSLVGALCSQVQQRLGEAGQPGPGGTAVDGTFIEHGPQMLELLEQEPFMALNRALLGTQDIVVSRSAAILRQPGSPQVNWHSDFDFETGPPTRVDGVLNRGEWPNGMWFYLTGSNPDHGGLAVIRGSHLPAWRPPAPWRLTEGWRQVHTAEGVPAAMDIPDAVALHADPGDLIVFAARTYHAAFPLLDRPRLSCGVVFRPRSAVIQAPWALPAATSKWLAGLPGRLKPLFAGYTSIDHAWRPAAVAPAPDAMAG